MNRPGVGEWRRKRRSHGGRSFRSGWVWGVTTLVVLSSTAMCVVWQKVRFEGVALTHSDLDVNPLAQRMPAPARAARADLHRRNP